MGWGKTRLKQEKIEGFGVWQRPARLEKPRLERDPAFLRLTSERDYSWYRWDTIGPNHPTLERLVVEVREPGPGNSKWEYYAREGVEVLNFRQLRWPEETGKARLTWQTEGPLRFTEGLYTVNTMDEPSWVVLLNDPAQGISVGYRVRKKDESLEDAKRVVREVAASVKLERDRAAIFAEERDRPHKQYREAVAKLSASLQAAGLRMPRLGEVLEQGDYVLSLTEDPDGDERFVIVQPIGEKELTATPSQSREYFDTDLKTDGYTAVTWLLQADGEWQYSGGAPDEMIRVLAKRARRPGSAYVYAQGLTFLRGDQQGPRTMNEFFPFAAEAAKRLKAGTLLQPRR